MSEKIIGHGTWYDKMAARVVTRERKLGRSLNLVRTEMGIAASGFPHVGNLSDAARSFAVTLALREQGFNSELVAFSDDKDGLRKVPAGMPDSLKEYLGRPVTDVPDFYRCHSSYGEHMSLLLREALDKCGIDYRFMSATEVYRKGLFNEEIRTMLLGAKRIGEIVKEELGQEKFLEALPYFAVCQNCGRIYTTKAYDFSPKDNKILYKCEGMEVKGQWLEGCGHQGEVDYRSGNGKLSWKGEFAVRWKALDIRFEAFGKDVADSVRVNDRICREILNWEPPVHAKYELFLGKSGRRFSKSAGFLLTPQTWFKYGSPQSVMLLLLKRFVGARVLDVTDIPTYMDELDSLEDVYFGKKVAKDERERAKLTGLYEYCFALHVPTEPSLHVPYNLLTYLAKVAPKGTEEEYVADKLRSYGYLKQGQTLDEASKKRVEYAFNWARDFEEIKEASVQLKEEERAAVIELVKMLAAEDEPEKIQNIVFNTAKKHGLQPSSFFKTIYTVLLGAPQGPRLGPYIIAMGKQNVINALNRALGSQS
ncbi:MAG TPA: lysine--tRNA ligase [Candidatus Acidoferrales bacterium]|nr:lysine--tRNA ligase [Candidatus Acidoferrales bacterium]